MPRTRREFLSRSASCAGWLFCGLALAPASVRRTFAARARKRVVAEEKFARIEQVAAGVWAVISTPFAEGGPFVETVSNGGIVAGKEGVLVIEGFYRDAGTAWLARHVRELTGREPTHVVVTHHHADHVRGLGGLSAGRPEGTDPIRMLTTPATRELMSGSDDQILPEASLGSTDGGKHEIDLGDRVVSVTTRKGHTPSDVTIEVHEPRVVFCGDLVWNGMFPNYVDAIPSHLVRHSEKILGKKRTTYVPGHGDLGNAKDLAPYLGVIRDVEEAARKAIERGTPAAEAAAEYEVPESLGIWSMFAPDLYERAFKAWERELNETATG